MNTQNSATAESSAGDVHQGTGTRAQSGRSRGWRWVFLLVALGVLGSWGLAVNRFGSLEAAKASLQGHVVRAENARKHLGDVPAERRSYATFQLQNLTSEPLTIYGAETSCGCVACDSLPMTIPPYGKQEVVFAVIPASKQVGEPFSERARLFIDRPGASLVLWIEADVRPGEAGES